jgi:EAL domain-containing protein (putative c-di-GMP-specific phosphodiesterase class I)
MLARSNDRLSLGVQLENALKHNGFTLNYQPIINVKTGVVDSMEALIRWQKPDGRWIPPGTFIPYAEAVGLIYRIDCWVLERACSDAASWARNGECNLGVAVNLSAVSVQQSNMAKVVEDVLQRTRLSPAMLTLEITETAVIADPRVARRVLDEIVALGVSLSVDDFGTGHSSLSYLTQFPIDYIKLDRLFVSRIGKDIASEQVIQSVLELAQRLGLRVIAEGIEEPEQQSFLTVAGCELMQGFYLMKPLQGHQLGDWLRAHRAASSTGNAAPTCLRPV